MQDIIVRALIIGASIGLLLGLTGYVEPGRAVALGMIAGFLAGLTKYRLLKARKKGERESGDSQ
jgi:H+/Cl- antiporter ClcA